MASIRFALARDSPALCPVEAGSHAYERRALLDRDREVLRGAHGKPASGRGSRRARGGRRSGAGCPPDPRRTAASSSARRPAPGSARGSAGSSSGAIPALPSSPATLTSTRISVSGVPWRSSWPSAESDATEWMSSTYGRICLTLRLWSWPMKCQRSSGCAVGLGLELLARGSRRAASRPASASTPSSSSAMYLIAASSSISAGSRPALRAAAAISSRTRSAAARTVSTSMPLIRPATRPPPGAR